MIGNSATKVKGFTLTYMTTVVKYKKLELLCVPETVYPYRAGRLKLDRVLASDQIYRDAKKGDIASDQMISSVLPDLTRAQAIEHILTHGDCPWTTAELRALKQERHNQLINYLVSNFTDPNGLTYPRSRIETVLKEAKVQVDHNKTAEQNFNKFRRKIVDLIALKPKLGLKLTINVSPQDAVKLSSSIHKYIVNSNYATDQVELELDVPADQVQRVQHMLTQLEGPTTPRLSTPGLTTPGLTPQSTTMTTPQAPRKSKKGKKGKKGIRT